MSIRDKLYYSEWSGIYPCSDTNCDYIGRLDAWGSGACYKPCPKCGSKKIERIGRFVYKMAFAKWKWLSIIQKRKFVRVEWRGNENG